MNNVIFFVVVVGLLVMFFTLCIIHAKDRRRQEKVFDIRRMIANQDVIPTTSYSPSEAVLIKPNRVLKQKNKGKDPYKEEYPSIKIHSYGIGYTLTSSKKGIW